MGAIIAAGVLEISALVWDIITFCACCCKRHILHPLYVLALAVAILLAVAVAVFYINNKDLISKYILIEILNYLAN